MRRFKSLNRNISGNPPSLKNIAKRNRSLAPLVVAGLALSADQGNHGPSQGLQIRDDPGFGFGLATVLV